MLEGADRLRTSLVPSLLEARRVNDSLSNPSAELFEVAKAYLPVAGRLPDEPVLLGLVSGGGFFRVKGAVEALVAEMNPETRLQATDWIHPLLDAARVCELRIEGRQFGFLGELNAAGLKQFGLRSPAAVAELQLGELERIARLTPQYRPLSMQQPIERDLNLIVPEKVRWSDLAETVRQAAGPTLERIAFREEFRDPTRDGPGRKRLLFSYTLRPQQATFTSRQAGEIQQAIIDACAKGHEAAVAG
jgi:phenylalanyl-tRNA synthetase beta chain